MGEQAAVAIAEVQAPDLEVLVRPTACQQRAVRRYVHCQHLHRCPCCCSGFAPVYLALYTLLLPVLSLSVLLLITLPQFTSFFLALLHISTFWDGDPRCTRLVKGSQKLSFARTIQLALSGRGNYELCIVSYGPSRRSSTRSSPDRAVVDHGAVQGKHSRDNGSATHSRSMYKPGGALFRKMNYKRPHQECRWKNPRGRPPGKAKAGCSQWSGQQQRSQ